MRKNVMVLFIVLVAVALMCGAVFAGTTTVNHGGANNSYSIAVETLGVFRDITMQGNRANNAQNILAGNVALAYALTQDMTTQNLLQVTLNNAAFNGGQIFMCSPEAANLANAFRVGVGTPTVNATTFNFQSAANVSSGSFVFLTDWPCAVGGGVNAPAAAANLSLRVPANLSVGMGTVTLQTVTAGNIIVDPASTANAINVAREFTTALTTRNMVIDYLNTNGDGTGDGTKFVEGASSNVVVTRGGVAIAAANTFAITYTAVDFETIADAVLVPTFTATTDAATDWSGAANAYFSTGIDCTVANISGAANTSPSGAVTLTSGNLAAAANAFDLCVTVNGATELQPRTIAGNYRVNLTGVGANPAAATTGNFQVWTNNGYQAYVPHMRWSTDGTTRTFVRFVNRANRAATAQVSVQISGATPVTYALADVPANGIITYNAQAIAESNGITADNYAALFTIKTGRNNIYADGFFNLAGTGSRMITFYENPANKDFQLK